MNLLEFVDWCPKCHDCFNSQISYLSLFCHTQKKLGMKPLILQHGVFVAQAMHQTVSLFYHNEALMVHIKHIWRHLLLHVHYFDHLYQLSPFRRFQMQKNLVKLLVLTSRHVFKFEPFVGLVRNGCMSLYQDIIIFASMCGTLSNVRFLLTIIRLLKLREKASFQITKCVPYVWLIITLSSS